MRIYYIQYDAVLTVLYSLFECCCIVYVPYYYYTYLSLFHFNLNP